MSFKLRSFPTVVLVVMTSIGVTSLCLLGEPVLCALSFSSLIASIGLETEPEGAELATGRERHATQSLYRRNVSHQSTAAAAG